jgi:hypothetical protein
MGTRLAHVISPRQVQHPHTTNCYLCDLMPLPVGSISQYNLRNSNNYVLPNCRLEITKKSFFPSTTRDWNNLSPEIRNYGNINIFKRKIKRGSPVTIRPASI